jgi:hypothetical protein
MDRGVGHPGVVHGAKRGHGRTGHVAPDIHSSGAGRGHCPSGLAAHPSLAAAPPGSMHT